MYFCWLSAGPWKANVLVLSFLSFKNQATHLLLQQTTQHWFSYLLLSCSRINHLIAFPLALSPWVSHSDEILEWVCLRVCMRSRAKVSACKKLTKSSRAHCANLEIINWTGTSGVTLQRTVRIRQAGCAHLKQQQREIEMSLIYSREVGACFESNLATPGERVHIQHKPANSLGEGGALAGPTILREAHELAQDAAAASYLISSWQQQWQRQGIAQPPFKRNGPKGRKAPSALIQESSIAPTPKHSKFKWILQFYFIFIAFLPALN